MQPKTTAPILVTGASGYLASHLIKLLLEKGYKVRGTVRSLANKAKYQFLYDLVPEKNDNLELAEANLSEKACWLTAVKGYEYVLHVASPVPPYVPKDEMELIGPAVAGAENVLEAALAKNIKKVVMTSSCQAIYFGNEGKTVTEEDWSVEEKCPAYPKSKLNKSRKSCMEIL
jgi:dihydroflavonol-4-reductase